MIATSVDVCALADLAVDRGVAVLVDGVAVAIFRRAGNDRIYALANIDPYSEASVMSRGIVGTIGGRPMVASPVFKQRFDLETGVALDDPTVALAVHPVEVRDGRVVVLLA